MSLVTRCPVCATTFRVLPAQLSARGGRVRCGKCSSAFDGVGNLLSEEAVDALPDEPSPQLGLFESRGPSEAPTTADNHQVSTEPAELAAAEPEPASTKPGPTRIETVAPATLIIETAGLAARRPPDEVAVPAFLAADKPAATFVLTWSLLVLIAFCTLGLQAGLHFRTEIGVLLPAARPYLEAACDALGCQVSLPRRVDLISIESSDLQADSQRPGVIVLNALLRNRAPFSQEFPNLELTLTDQGERPVIRKILEPRDYLPEKRAALTQGMGGGTEEAVRMFFHTGGILATGYQLFLFYPCPPLSSSPFWQLSYPSRCQNSGHR